MSPQLGLFGGAPPPAAAVSAPSAEADLQVEILAALRRIEPDDMSPRAAWDLLAELRRKLTGSH